MPATPPFPLLPADARYWSKIDRARDEFPTRTPVRQRVWPSASVLAGKILRRYLRLPAEPGASFIRVEAGPLGPSLYEQIPRRFVQPLAVFAACAVLVPQLLFVLCCAPQLHPRVARRAMLTPRDVRKILLVHRAVTGAIAAAGRLARRRFAAEMAVDR